MVLAHLIYIRYKNNILFLFLILSIFFIEICL